MERWEYMTVETEDTHSGTQVSIIRAPSYLPMPAGGSGDVGHAALRILDELGADGWELVDVRELSGPSTYWLKRRITSEPEQPPDLAFGIA
jgi:hypothetical protein